MEIQTLLWGITAPITAGGQQKRNRATPSFALVFRLAVAFSAGSTVSGCTLVEKRGPDGAVEHSISLFAPVTVIDQSDRAARAVRVAGLGVGVTAGVLQAGFFGISSVTLDPSCRVVLFPRSDLEAERFRQLLRETPGLCDEAKFGGSD